MISRTNPPRPAAALYLLDGVRDYFQTNEVSTLVVFGFKERAKQITQGIGVKNRIVIIPGKINGDDGPLKAATGPGGNPRKLFTQEKIVTLSLFAGAPNADERNEEALIGLIDELEEQILSAVQAVLMNDATWGSAKYNADPIETRFGLEYLIELSISGTYRALEAGIPTTGVTAVINRGGETAPTIPTP